MKTKKNLRILNVIAMVLCLVMAFSMTAFADTTTNAAKIGDTEYATLAEAVKAVEKSAGETTITLLKDQTISGQMIGHQYVQNIVLDLGGYTLSSNGITLTSYRSGTTLTIKNGTVSGNSTSGTLRGTYGGTLILGDNLTVKGAGGSATLVYLDNGKMDIAAENGVAFTGGKLDFKQSANVNNKMNVAASVGRTYFATLADAFAAADGETVTLLTDVALSETVKVNGNVTLDLAGKTITGTDNATSSFALIEIQPGAALTVNDTAGEGKITLTAANDRSTNSYSSVISNQRGTLTVNGGTIEHLGGTYMAYAIDNLTNTGAQKAETTITGGTVKSTYRAIRQFANSSTGMNTLTITGGTVASTGGNYAVWLQSANTSANMASMTITGDAEVGKVYVWAPGNGDASALTLAVDANCVENVVDGLPGVYEIVSSNGVYTVAAITYVAQVGDTKYETLSAAIAAKAGNTITLLNNVNENVTISESLTIDGADKNYTGTMTVNTSLNVTIQNVNFVKGCITELAGAHGNLTIKNCSFDGVDKSIVYAITQRGGDKIVIENSTAKNYSYGMLYIPSSVNIISVKDVEVENCTAAFNISYSNDGTFENVELNNVTYGLHVQNHGARTFTLNGCDFNCKYPIYVQNKGTATVTFKFVGENTFVTETSYADKYAKLILAKDAVLTAPQLFDVTTNVEDYEVVYSNGAYSLVTGDARIVNGALYDTLAEAIAAAQTGDTVKVLKNVSVDADDLVDLDGYHTFFKVDGKSITVDLNGKTITADASAVTDKFVVGVFSAANGGELTLTGDGTVQGYSGATQEAAYLDPAKGNTDYNYKFYTLLASYNDDTTITVEGGNYILDYAGDSMAYSSGNEGIVVNSGTFNLGNLGGIRNGMPWVFNARGQNVRHVVVNGGSFCADIQHQYYPFEVEVPETLALKYENGMYNVVEAVAYVTEREWSSAWYTNEVGYATLEEAIAACEGPKTRSKKTSEQEVVVLLKDITLADDTTIVIDKPVSIDLAEHTIYGENTRTNTHNFLIDVKGGTLTASNGTIAMKHTGANMEWNGATTVIDVTAGGVLNLDGVTVQNQGGTDMNFAVHMNNWGEVTLNADNCVFDAPYCGVRVFNSGFDMNNVTITNSKLTGKTRAFWVHNYLGDLDSTKHSDEAIKARLNLNIYGNNNTFEITDTAKSPIRYGFEKTVYFDGNGYQVVDSAESLQDAINNGSGNIILDGDINLGGSIVIP